MSCTLVDGRQAEMLPGEVHVVAAANSGLNSGAQFEQGGDASVDATVPEVG